MSTDRYDVHWHYRCVVPCTRVIISQSLPTEQVFSLVYLQVWPFKNNILVELLHFPSSFKSRHFESWNLDCQPAIYRYWLSESVCFLLPVSPALGGSYPYSKIRLLHMWCLKNFVVGMCVNNKHEQYYEYIECKDMF